MRFVCRPAVCSPWVNPNRENIRRCIYLKYLNSYYHIATYGYLNANKVTFTLSKILTALWTTYKIVGNNKQRQMNQFGSHDRHAVMRVVCPV